MNDEQIKKATKNKGAEAKFKEYRKHLGDAIHAYVQMSSMIGNELNVNSIVGEVATSAYDIMKQVQEAMED